MMTELLQDLVVVFLLAVIVVIALRRIKVPSIAGFIVAGILVGPEVLNVIDDVHKVEVLAEIGVALLLFGIGLELSLERMRRLWRILVIGGAFQVGATVVVATIVSRLFGLGLGPSVFVGCVIAVSSTAVVLSGLRARGEIDAPHGRLTLGILVFQDLCVVPMMLVIPLLAGTGGSGASMVVALAKSAGVLAVVLVAARLIVPRVLHFVALARQRDVFVLTVFLVCIGTAWVVSMAGVSVALGAFLGGLVVSGSQYRHQALSELIPFREVFSSLFFVSIGMLLSPLAIASSAGTVLALLAAIVVGKFILVLTAGAVLRLPVRTIVMAAAALCQVGEFSFVLLNSGNQWQILPAPFVSDIYVAIILSMLITPMFIALAPRLAAGASRVSVITRSWRVPTADDMSDEIPLHDHVIIAGFGVTGRELSLSLKHTGITYIVVDMNPETVSEASAQGENVCFGDVTSREVLHSLGIERAREFVIAINDPGASERAVRVARAMAPKLPIFVRAAYAVDLERMIDAGATDVIVAELEASAAMTARMLVRHQIGLADMQSDITRIREGKQESE